MRAMGKSWELTFYLLLRRTVLSGRMCLNFPEHIRKFMNACDSPPLFRVRCRTLGYTFSIPLSYILHLKDSLIASMKQISRVIQQTSLQPGELCHLCELSTNAGANHNSRAA